VRWCADMASARLRIVLAVLLPPAWSYWVSSRSFVPTQHHHLRQFNGLCAKSCGQGVPP
jgi:hypothetical protein